jgi:serine phosphatase RsbU (regulator of sigma subunit)
MAHPLASAVREILASIPAGCSWLLPVRDEEDRLVDFRIAAASGSGGDLHGRGTDRVGELLSELYPSMVGGDLWQLYVDVLLSGRPGELSDFHYREKISGVVAESEFDVSVHPLHDGLLVWWRRIDEHRRRLDNTELLGRLGWAEYDLTSGRSEWSPGMFRIFERDPRLGPMSRAEQAAALVTDDHGLRETAWQTLDSGNTSDVTVRFRFGGTVKHLRILSDIARDADGTPVKIYAVVQDVTAREDSRTAIQRLSDQLHRREMTALAEHRLAGQLQNLIQPLVPEPFPLNGLHALVSYLPAESATRVGGDWYHAQTLADGRVLLAIGDVAGHGLEAASGMAHLRFALVAWLSIGIADPSTLIGHLNQLCGQLEITGTALIAAYEPATRSLVWARAGHLPPLLARAGSVEELVPPPGLLLGADDQASYSVVAQRLRADDVLLLYTDGLIERHAADTSARLEEVKEAMCAATFDPLRAVLRRPSPYDDSSALAVRVTPTLAGQATPTLAGEVTPARG